MQILIWTGAGVTLIGLLGLLWCIIQALSAKREKLSDEAMRARLGRLMPINLASLSIATIGLILVIVGIVLA
ncbi:MAG: HAMP domain [Rhodobacteraceae bacterium HLUCCO07]|nr:MAG: HAMP domain [Rhodobacteraceae bacterium HLUCCO07]